MAASTTNTAKFNSGPWKEKDTAAAEKTMMMKMSNLASYSKPAVANLMQNCDLPPPAKLLSWPENSDEIIGYDGKLEILRALRSSQTRAREAEKRTAALAEEKDRLERALVENSMRLFGYRQLVRLLDVQVKIMRFPWQFRPEMSPACRFPDEPEAGGGQWFTVLAVGFGIASVGFAFCYNYLYPGEII